MNTGAALAAAHRVSNTIAKAQRFNDRVIATCSALEAARAACSGAALYIVSRAVLAFGVDQLALLFAVPGAGTDARLAAEARGCLTLAAVSAWAGAECRSALCALLYVEINHLVGPVDGAPTKTRLAGLVKTLLLHGEWEDPRAELQAATSGAKDNKRSPSSLEEMVLVRALRLLS